MIRLGFYTENYIIGGTERYLGDLLGGLDRRQYDISLFSNPNRAFKDYLRMRGLDYIPHWTVPILPPYPYLAVRWANQSILRIKQTGPHSQKKKTLQHRKIKEVINGLWRYATANPNMALLASALRSRRIDILHINNGGYPGGETCRLAALAANWVKIPVRLMSIHNLARKVVFPGRMERFLDQQVYDSLNLILTASHASRHSLEQVRRFQPKKMRTVHYGIDDSILTSNCDIAARRKELGVDPEKTKLIGMVANFEERKGHEFLLRAVPEICSRVPNVKVILVGEGGRRKNMMDLANDLGIGHGVVFTGTRSDVFNLVATLDIFVLASVAFESLPYVVLEAMALGKPVVATRVAGIPEEVEGGVTGILVAPADPKSLAQAIISLLVDKSKAHGMGEAGRARYLKKFTLQRMINDVERIYAEQTGRAQLM